MSGEDDGTESDKRLDRAVRLFEFLARVQQIKTRTPRTVEAYERDGDVIWLDSLPSHPAINTVHRVGGVDPGDAMLTVERVPRLAPPSPPEAVAPWLVEQIDDPETEPSLVLERAVDVEDGDESSTAVEPERLEDNPDVIAGHNRWLPTWRAWAAHELESRPVRAVYGRLFSIHITAVSHPEELEVVCGIGCLGWQPEQHDRALRHAFTAAAAVDFDDDSGRLTVRAIESMDALSLELDMLDPAIIRDPQRISEIRDDARTLEAHPLDRDAASLLGRRLVHCLDPDGQYVDEDRAPGASPNPVISFAPAMILRKRSQQGLLHVFEEIANQMRDAGEVPEGLLPLIDPNHRPDPGLTWEGADGAMVTVDDEVFLPLPLNEAQFRVVKRVDVAAQTLVQGPPGTGKTHTAAALIAHLLAQGKRVLVTAQTDRALKEVRTKLPDAIKPLSVAVVGTGREDMADLKIAVERLAAAATDHDDAEATRQIDKHLGEIDLLRRQRANVHHRLLKARESEVSSHDRPAVSGTLATIALWYEDHQTSFSWIRELVEVAANADPPISDSEAAEWHRLLLDEGVRADEGDALKDLLDPTPLPSPQDFAGLVLTERTARAADGAFEDVHDHDAFEAFMQLPPATRDALRTRLHSLADEAESLARRHEAWMASALSDIQRGRATPWRARRDEVAELLSAVRPVLARIGSVRQVRCDVDPGPLMPLARGLREHLANDGKLKKDASGRPKVGPLGARPVKDAAPLFDAVLIDGLPPTSVADLDHFTDWVGAARALDALDRAWPDGVLIPAEDTQSERLHWHVTELEQLDRLLALADRLAEQDAALVQLDLRPMDWGDLVEVRRFGRVVDAVNAREEHEDAIAPLSELEGVLGTAARWRDAGQCVLAMEEAVRLRAFDRYREAWDRLHHLLSIRDLIGRRDELGERLEEAAPRLHAAMVSEPAPTRWHSCLAEFEAAWNWASTGSWIRQREQLDVNQLQRELDVAEEGIRGHVEQLASDRAWKHAVSTDRMTGQARANLEQYAYLVRRLGKGTGKYAAQRRSEIRGAMDRCRPSVPVWIMPIYRIAEQLRVAPDIFDVVVVDEASQAGLESTFLQYLAPKIVVIGDDKQVSPAAVGIDQQELRDLAAQYLYDDVFRASWQDPQRSLFDEAKMRYGGLITLVEHRRCVPEIIGFSNRVAYEPEGIRLIPVRQYGADRLDPIRPVFLDQGYTRGGQTRINPVEVDAIVEQIEKCLADSAYDGLTFGMISLLGPAQAKQIEKALLERISPEEWTARELRCGDSADFQGSERDVMFLSMVAAPEPGRRLTALTQQMYLQRYNVAASRAKDQMWLYHSIALSELGNTEDLRFQLLDYCYATLTRSTQSDTRFTNPVPEDVRVSPFDSLFEQRVFNRLIDRGYVVVPQYEVESYRIDLVILGSKTKVAIECDGDAWHGPDRYEADLARKRDLERCGWKFFNIRESMFYVDRAAALAPLWDMLAALEVHPSGWVPPASSAPPASPARPASPAPLERADLGSPGDAVAVVASTRIGPADARREHRAGQVPDSPEVRVLEGGELDLSSGLLGGAYSSQIAELVTPAPNASASTAAGLSSYTEYSGHASRAVTATQAELVEELVAVVAVEGPVLGERLHQAHVKSAGGQRVGRQIAHELNAAITTAKRRGLLIEDNPLADSGVKPMTFRLPSQRSVVVRELGPRSLAEVPPRELAALLAEVASAVGWRDEEVLFRAVLDRYGLRRLTTNANALLRRVRSLAEHPDSR